MTTTTGNIKLSPTKQTTKKVLRKKKDPVQTPDEFKGEHTVDGPAVLKKSTNKVQKKDTKVAKDAVEEPLVVKSGVVTPESDAGIKKSSKQKKTKGKTTKVEGNDDTGSESVKNTKSTAGRVVHQDSVETAGKLSDEKNVDEGEKKLSNKKVNNKPTLSNVCGLNISVAKVKNIISNMCINSESFKASQEIKDARVFSEPEKDSEKKQTFKFSLDSLSKETVAFLDKCDATLLEGKKLLYTKEKIKNMDKESRERYTAAKKLSTLEHENIQMNTQLFQKKEFDLDEFNLSYDSHFYDDFQTNNWKLLKDEELYSQCTSLLNKVKVRFNSESKIFITAFIERIVEQMVFNGTINCVSNKKKIIKLEHALDVSSDEAKERFGLYPIITTLPSFRKLKNSGDSEDSENSESLATDAEEEDVAGDSKTESVDATLDKKFQFKYYVYELCRSVRMDLAKTDAAVEDPILSEYNLTSVSKAFKQFCSDIVIDLLHVFGDVLKVEVETRNVKTVNYNIVGTLLYSTHLLFSLNDELDKTITFIQDRYIKYNKYLEERKEKKGLHTEDD